MLSSIVLFFGDNCREAFEFYGYCFDIEPVFDNGENLNSENINTAHIAFPSFILEGVNLGSGTKINNGNNFAIKFDCPDFEYFDKVVKNIEIGGEIIAPIVESMFGGVSGIIKDKFGIHWVMSFFPDEAQNFENAH